MHFVSVTHKTALISFLIGLLIMIFAAVILNSVIYNYVDRIEAGDVTDAYDELKLILHKEEDNLRRTSLDWAHWDDTYAFVAGKTASEYKEDNLQAATLRQLNLNFMLFINDRGDNICTVTNNLGNNTADLLTTNQFTPPADLNQLLTFADNNDVHAGLLTIQGNQFIVAAAPVTTSDELASGNGALVIGRYVDDSLLDYIGSVTKTKVSLRENPANRQKTDPAVQKSRDYITTHQPIVDVHGKPTLLATLSIPRTEYHLGQYYISAFEIIFFAILLLFIIINLATLNKCLLKRLKSIHEFIDNIALTGDIRARLTISGNDEIAAIANSTNRMLLELENTHNDVSRMTERIQMIVEATDDGYLEYNLKTKQYYISPKWGQFTAEQVAAAGFDPIAEYLKRLPPASMQAFTRIYYSLVTGPTNYAELEYKMSRPDKSDLWVLHRSRVVERDSNGQALRIVSTLLDITARKKYEEKILQLSYYDKLTGLQNRTFMEHNFAELDRRSDCRYAIIMGDVNGLKLINDTFGHKEGDRLIYTVGQIIKNLVPENDLIARWGGDEFVILSLNTEETRLTRLIADLKKKCAEITDFGFKISIALGYAGNNERPDSEGVMSLAEERMYRSKLLATKSSRNATIISLAKTLYEKHSETEEHTLRIKELSLPIGKKINLSPDKLCELELVSLLHDIGKIGIPDQILSKPGNLTAEEWQIMKRHCEIGYRIAKATPGLVHVAEEILSHHERFDGTGYPQGLKGSEIPVLSRIINVVDSFDVITHQRSYKPAASVEYALAELRRGAGTQFDPAIVTEFINLFTAKNTQTALG